MSWKKRKRPRSNPFHATDTRSEEHLLIALESDGILFRYHPIIAGHEADFLFLPKIVVEVDGGVHRKSEVKQRDLEITRTLERLGYKVVRIQNERVDTREGAKAVVRSLKKLAKTMPAE